jgi:membrane protease YdiL (CAAX protease family)
MKFLNTPSTTFWAKLRTIIFGFLICVIWIYSVTHLLNWLYPPTTEGENPFYTPPPMTYELFMACIFAPLWEELAFRHAPGLLVKALGDKFLIPIMILSSIIFGWGHGHGPESVMRQGAMGFVFFYVYIKNGYSYWSSVVLHAAWNTFVFFLV